MLQLLALQLQIMLAPILISIQKARLLVLAMVLPNLIGPLVGLPVSKILNICLNQNPANAGFFYAFHRSFDNLIAPLNHTTFVNCYICGTAFATYLV